MRMPREETNRMKKEKESDYIPTAFYDKIRKTIPIASVEALIFKDNALLLMRRNTQPAKGELWFPGGRIRKGENLEQTLHREVKEETGLDVNSYKLINVYSRIFPERQDITIVYQCTCKGKVKLNNEHSEYGFFKTLPNGLNPYLLETIKDAQRKHM